jgi:hypothetical protein
MKHFAFLSMTFKVTAMSSRTCTAPRCLNSWDTFTDYVEGHTSGRKVFSLPTGMGKTSAVAAFVAALHKLKHSVAVAVSASQVEALCRLKREPRQWGQLAL